MRQYTVEFNGQTFTRKTERTYSHLVLGVHSDAATHQYRPGTYVLGWAGSLKLADARTRGWEASRFTSVHVVEITPEMTREIQPRAKKEAA